MYTTTNTPPACAAMMVTAARAAITLLLSKRRWDRTDGAACSLEPVTAPLSYTSTTRVGEGGAQREWPTHHPERCSHKPRSEFACPWDIFHNSTNSALEHSNADSTGEATFVTSTRLLSIFYAELSRNNNNPQVCTDRGLCGLITIVTIIFNTSVIYIIYYELYNMQ